jgi:hypothetical protein
VVAVALAVVPHGVGVSSCRPVIEYTMPARRDGRGGLLPLVSLLSAQMAIIPGIAAPAAYLSPGMADLRCCKLDDDVLNRQAGADEATGCGSARGGLSRVCTKT